MSQTITKTEGQSKVEERTKQPWLWNVVLLNDDDHSVDYVVEMLGNLFAHPIPKGLSLAMRVDKDGRAIVATTHKEHAELKRDQIHAFGRDRYVAECQGSMSSIIEPAEFEGQGGGEPPKASDANPPAATRATPGEARSAPMKAKPVAMKKKKKKGGMAATNSKNHEQGSETGSAKDSAGPAGMRAAPDTGNTK